MSNTKNIIFVPQAADLATYNLSVDDANRLLDALDGDCVEVAPGTGVYTVSSIDKVAEAYNYLIVKE